ncbi:hypothetical protein M440DRAFT_1328966, partial [Trichoderma longibrachiatum ATCC 18648]
CHRNRQRRLPQGWSLLVHLQIAAFQTEPSTKKLLSHRPSSQSNNSVAAMEHFQHGKQKTSSPTNPTDPLTLIFITPIARSPICPPTRQPRCSTTIWNRS